MLKGLRRASGAAPRYGEGLAGYQGVVNDGLKLGILRQGFDVNAWFEPRFVQQAVRDLKLERFWSPLDAQGKAKGAA